MPKNIDELREKRAKLIADAQEIMNKSTDESRDLTGEENQTVDRMLEEVDSLAAEIDTAEQDWQRRQRVEAAAADLGKPANGPGAQRSETRPNDPGQVSTEQRNAAIGAYLRYGINGMPPEQRAIMGALQADLTPEMRAMATDPGAAGGFQIPEDTSLYAAIVQGMALFGGVREAVVAGGGLISSSFGGSLPIPTDDDQELGERLAENTAANEQDVVVGQVVLGAHIYSSKMVRASVPYITDSATDTDAWLGGILGRRLGRIYNKEQTTGAGGGSEPLGVVTGTTNSATAAAAAAIAYDDTIELQHAVDPAYRNLPGCRYMFNDTTLKLLRKLKDSDGQYIWSGGTQAGEPESINGKPYTLNQDMADVGASADSMMFGDFGHYRIREVAGVTLMRLAERYAEFWQVAFLAWARMDAAPVDPGGRALAKLSHPAS